MPLFLGRGAEVVISSAFFLALSGVPLANANQRRDFQDTYR